MGDTSRGSYHYTSLLTGATSSRRRIHLLVVTSIVLFGGLLFLLVPPRYAAYNEQIQQAQVEANNLWYLSVFSPYYGFGRRQIIRSTWQRLYKHNTPMTTRFVIGQPDKFWEQHLRWENETYGDLVQVDIPDERRYAIFVKPIMAMQKLAATGQRWKFYSKVDDDSFFAAKPYFDLFLAPRLNGSLPSTKSIIGRLRRARRFQDDEGEVSYAQGGLYTMTWDLVEDLVRIQEDQQIDDMDEDVLVGRLLEIGNVKWNLTKLPEPVSFEWDQKDTVDFYSCWAKPDSNQNAWSHALGPKAMHVHNLKEERDFFKVANCFDENGVKRPPEDSYGLDDDWYVKDVDEFNKRRR